MALAFSHVQIYVHDLKRAMRFYQRVLGFLPDYVAEPHYARLRNDAMQLVIALHHAHEPADVGNGAVAYLKSDQFDETIRELRAGNHKLADKHELHIINEETALIEVYQPTPANLTKFGAKPEQQWIVDAIIQGRSRNQHDGLRC